MQQKRGTAMSYITILKTNKLGMWVKNQISHNRLLQEGKQSQMTEDTKYLLESIGFVWERSKNKYLQESRLIGCAPPRVPP